MSSPRQVIVFEPRADGHHPKWAGLVANALQAAGMRVHLAVSAQEAVQPYLVQDCQPEVHPLNAVDGLDELTVASRLVEKTGADEVFWTSLDNFASALLRRAALGAKPTANLRGKISGVYHRPRPLDPSQTGFSNALKRHGFIKLQRGGWWGRMALLDPMVVKAAQRNFPGLCVGLLPDPAEFTQTPDKTMARSTLGVPTGKIALLHFGVFAQRKGLGLLLDALKACPEREQFFLLRAGKVPADGELHTDLVRVHEMAKLGQALSLDVFVDSETEAQLYAATDIVTLPYRAHYGSANLLSAAAAATRPVLASDHHLTGRLVTDNQIGWTFQDGDTADLARTLSRIAETFPKAPHAYDDALQTYAQSCNTTAFSRALSELWQS